MSKIEQRLFILFALLLATAAVFSVGYHHFDEHFQILEFANYKLGKTARELLPWEFEAQLRPAFQPWIAFVVMKYSGMENPFHVAMFLRFLSGFVHFLSVYIFYRVFRAQFHTTKATHIFLWSSMFLWFGIYNGVRFSSEGWASSLFVLGLSLYFGKDQRSIGQYILIGCLLGFSYLARFQMGLMIVGLVAWIFVMRKKYLTCLWLTIGVLMAFGAGIALDRWLYGEWTFTTWHYFEINLLEGKAASFGVDPWYKYFVEAALQAIPTVGIPLIVCLFWIILSKPKDFLAWIVLPFLLIHFLIAHKETRFLIPLTGLFPLALAGTVDSLKVNFYMKKMPKTFAKVVAFLFWATNVVFCLVVAFRPADNHIGLYQTIYECAQGPAVAYCIKDNPYDRVEDICFYKREDLKLEHLSSIAAFQNDSSKKQLIIIKNESFELPEGLQTRCVYQTFPAWMSNFNWGNWMRRAPNWEVYEVLP
jgi:GPI mannosyltransferase 3